MSDDAQKKRSMHVFLSHASEDKPAVRAFTSRLQQAGLKVWLDEEQLPPGYDPQEAIRQGMEASQHVLVWVTERWLNKTWTRWELKLFAEARVSGRRIIPILGVAWDDGVLGPYLSQTTSVNPDVDDDQRLWLAFCGIVNRPPGEKGRWAEHGRALSSGTELDPLLPLSPIPPPSSGSQEGSQRLWQIRDPGRVVIITANSSSMQTGEYVRNATGIGQVRALAYIVPSLHTAYAKLDLRNIYLSTDPIQDRCEDDLIILGGAKNNSIASDLFDALAQVQPVTNQENRLIWRREVNGVWTDDGAEVFKGDVRNGDVRTDYGLILRVANPFTSRDRTAVLLAGGHTYGTMAAAKFFVENLLREMPDEVDGKNNLSVLIECRIMQGFPTSMKIRHSFVWPREQP